MAAYQRESDKEMTASRRRHPPDDKNNTTQDSKTSHKAPDYFLSLPDELLVKIMSLLPETHDRVKFRYVSRRLQKISETPSLLVSRGQTLFRAGPYRLEALIISNR